jgi:hypothetical protein
MSLALRLGTLRCTFSPILCAIMIIPTGIKIIKNSAVFDKMESRQVRFPKSKKRRIRNKWRKKPQNYKSFFISFTAIKIGDQLHVSEKGYKFFSDKYNLT